MKISEIFSSIQGEGRNIGKPSTFVRTAICNQHCVWCDTAYTWNWEHTSFEHKYKRKYNLKEEITEMSVEKVLLDVIKKPERNVVLTGGEPMLQQDDLYHLMSRLLDEDGFYFEVETAGTILPKSSFNRYVGHYNVSVKLSNSKNPGNLRLRPDVLNYFSKNEKAYFKFVVDRQVDIDEVKELQESYKIPESRIYLMPQGTTSEELISKHPWIAELCKENGYNMTTRLQILTYGSKRGT